MWYLVGRVEGTAKETEGVAFSDGTRKNDEGSVDKNAFGCLFRFVNANK